jgi:hypothetical protein
MSHAADQHMGAFALLRAQRRLSGVIVVALLILGGISASHHHRLMPAGDALAFTAPGGPTEHPSRTTDCVVCRAADPAPIVVVVTRVPQVVVTRVAVAAVSEETRQAAFRPSSPRAPPVLS